MMRWARAATSLALSASLVGCGTVAGVKDAVIGSDVPRLGPSQELVTGFLGGVAADEPGAVLVGKQILVNGGSAADAAAAVAFALTVTLPSRAGLGAGGACIAYAPPVNGPGRGVPEAILFTLASPADHGGTRPAAVPMLAAGMVALQARYGVLPIQQVLAPAEQLARLGVHVSRGFAADLAVVGPALMADPGAAAVFGAGGAPLAEGDLMTQPALGGTLADLRVHGVADLYGGPLGQSLIAGMPQIGARLTLADLQAAAPRRAAPLLMSVGTTPGADRVAFLPPPADGGLAAAAAFQLLQVNRADTQAANARALGAASAWRAGGGGDPNTILGSTATPANTLDALPASTSFVTLDRTGGAVACAVSMGNLFGTGRIASGTGMLLAASPTSLPSPLLAAAIAFSPSRHAFRAAVAGSGQSGAPLGVALGLLGAMGGKSAMPATVPNPGRINALACQAYLPGDTDQCTWATDPRGDGLAVGSN